MTLLWTALVCGQCNATLNIWVQTLQLLQCCQIFTPLMRRHNWYWQCNQIMGCICFKSLPKAVADLTACHSFFHTTAIEDSFLDSPVDLWPSSKSCKKAATMISNLAGISDCAERLVALRRTFSAATKDEDQRQYLCQLVCETANRFSKCNPDYLYHM